MTDIILEKQNNINSLKLELTKMKRDFEKNDEQLLLVKGRNLEIDQRVVRILEWKHAPYMDYMSQMLDVKLQPIRS